MIKKTFLLAAFGIFLGVFFAIASIWWNYRTKKPIGRAKNDTSFHSQVPKAKKISRARIVQPLTLRTPVEPKKAYQTKTLALKEKKENLAPQPFEPQSGMEQIEKLEKAGQYELAIPILKQLVEQNHLPALKRLGLYYQYGRGVEKDEIASLRMFEDVFSQGDSSVTSHIATLYLKGEGVQQDANEALKWYKRGAEKRQLKDLVGLVEYYRANPQTEDKNGSSVLPWIDLLKKYDVERKYAHFYDPASSSKSQEKTLPLQTIEEINRDPQIP